MSPFHVPLSRSIFSLWLLVCVMCSVPSTVQDTTTIFAVKPNKVFTLQLHSDRVQGMGAVMGTQAQ